MEENQQTPEPKPLGSKPDTVQLLYTLYLPSVLMFGIPAVIGVVMAYLNKAYAPAWLQTHYDYLINTFWKGALFLVISMVLMAVAIGFLTFLAGTVWWIMRCVKGMKLLKRKEPVPDPQGWGVRL